MYIIFIGSGNKSVNIGIYHYKTLNLETAKLIQNCAKGNVRWQKKLYEKYAGLLFSTVLRYIKNNENAEDILLQAFLKVYKNLPSFEYVNEKAFVGWMKKIAINEALVFLRNDFKTIYNIQQEYDFYNHSEFSSNEVEEQELLELIEQLPPGYKTVCLLHVVDGFSHKEIAEKLQIAESTSRSQFFKARNLLQKKLLNDYENAMGT